METSRSGIQGHPPLHIDFETRLGYGKPSLKTKKTVKGQRDGLVTEGACCQPKLEPQEAHGGKTEATLESFLRIPCDN